MTVPLQPGRQRRQLPPRRRRTERPIRPAQARPNIDLARRRDEGVEVTRLVKLAALNDRGVAEDIAQRLAQPLAAVDHPQHAPLEREPAGEQVLQQLGTQDRKSTRLNSSHVAISYAALCLKKNSVLSRDGLIQHMGA